MKDTTVFRKADVNAVVEECLKRGLPRIREKFHSYQGIHDTEDQTSDFLYGVALGLKKVKWSIGDPIEFLVNNGIFYLRTRRFRAFKKKFSITCECGKPLKMSQKPCHGTMESRSVQRREHIIDFTDLLATEESGGKLIEGGQSRQGFSDWMDRHS